MIEYKYLLLHILFGYILSFFYKLLIFKKRTISKDILFTLIYIFIYVKYICSICIVNGYLIAILIISFILFSLKFNYIKILDPFYNLIFHIKKAIFYILTPPIVKHCASKIKAKIKLYRYYKKYPHKKKSPLELF